MPNHITTRLVVSGPSVEVERFVSSHIVKDAEEGGLRFSLDSIVPMPPEVRDTMLPFPGDMEALPEEARRYGGDGTVALRAEAMLQNPRSWHPHQGYAWIPKHVQTWENLAAFLDTEYPGAKFWARRRLLCAAATGYPDWYEWSVANWGTKWDSYRYQPRERSKGLFAFAFETAWAPPLPCFRVLMKRWANLKFEVDAIDEGSDIAWVGAFENGNVAMKRVKVDDELYSRVYGRPRPKHDEDET